MKLKYALALLATLFMPQISHAQTLPPAAVFRFSNQSPTDIFANSFTAAGNNVDLLRFASGSSIIDHTSAYIPTTSSMAFALLHFRRFQQQHPDSEVYLYTIRPTISFHSLFVSLHWARLTLPNSTARQEAQTILLATPRVHEWVAVARITPYQIEGAQRLRLVDGLVRADAFQRNPNYLFLPSIVNSHPLPVHNAVDQEVQVAAGASNLLLLPAAFDNMGCDRTSQSFKAILNGACAPSHKLSVKTLRAKNVARLIVSSTLSGPTPIEI